MSRPKPNVILELGTHDINNSYFVYGLYRSGNNVPFYIGKARYARRPFEHIDEAFREISSKKNLHKINTIKKIAREQQAIIIRILFSSKDENEVLQEEIRLISHYGRADIGTGVLTNMTAGGDGISGYTHTPVSRKQISDSLKLRSPDIRSKAAEKMLGHTFNIGRVHTDETKCKISKANKGRTVAKDMSGNNNPFYGKRHSQESKEKMSKWHCENSKGENNPFYGKKHSDDAKIKIRSNNRSSDEDVKSKISAAMKGKPWSEARRAAYVKKKNKEIV